MVPCYAVVAGRFIIKTQTHEEKRFLLRILPHYLEHVKSNPDTLMTRFYGMHRVTMPHLKRDVHFVVMHSVFDTRLRVHEIYDLKGSTVGRLTGSGKERTPGVVYKDCDLMTGKVSVTL